MDAGEGEEQFGVPADSAGMVRRECAACHRTFKVARGQRDGISVLRALARKLPHLNDAELAECPPERFCPYCAECAPDDAWFTAEQRAVIEKRAEHRQREIRHAQLMQPRASLGQNPYVTYLAVEPEPFAGRMPSAGDPLRPFPLVCCRETVRIERSWDGPVHCHFCGCEHEIDRKMPGFLERLDTCGVDIK